MCAYNWCGHKDTQVTLQGKTYWLVTGHMVRSHSASEEVFAWGLIPPRAACIQWPGEAEKAKKG